MSVQEITSILIYYILNIMLTYARGTKINGLEKKSNISDIKDTRPHFQMNKNEVLRYWGKLLSFWTCRQLRVLPELFPERNHCSALYVTIKCFQRRPTMLVKIIFVLVDFFLQKTKFLDFNFTISLSFEVVFFVKLSL